ncbi:MAG: hypothetical protein HYY02_05335 [Chloroflexi bacterium]|nr:hypothetical protein [Chloroflexota bacterium]
MRREELLMTRLAEIEDEGLLPQEALARHADLRSELAPLLRTTLRLQDLPKNVTLAPASKARLRAQLLVAARRATPAPGVAAWWDALRAGAQDLLAPPRVGGLLARPAGLALALLLTGGMVSASTVSAALDSLPGDNLYPVRLAAEQTRLALSFTDAGKAETYLWIASSRVDALSKLGEPEKLHLAAQTASDYQYSVAQALRLSAAQKTDEGKLQQQLARVQTSMQEIYEKAPPDLQVTLAQTLTLATSTGSLANTGPAIAPESGAGPGPSSVAAATEGAGTIAAAPPAGGIPVGGKRVDDKGDNPPEPTPGKSGPISNPSAQPAPSGSERVPDKNDGSPGPGPVPGKESSVVTPGAPGEPGKSDPTSPNPPGPSGDSLAPKDGAPTGQTKNGGGLQGAQGRPLP